ncbi:hypothetical protein EQG68_02380 [Flavobacterium piscinae]|uniref:Uncharacterized protein n=1 Tax=Flavobacterium piscinae TaxID=2506424 RepID=A0A4V1N584_9FLAO|nr:hypothetical protein [Flavobacterium piscinae]RXR34776.1 hypothetical protein EQG68_02380 [Flavobacterium piscinae]
MIKVLFLLIIVFLYCHSVNNIFKELKYILAISIFIFLQIILSLLNFYSNLEFIQLKMILTLLVPTLIIIFHFQHNKNSFIKISYKNLTLIHFVRIPIEFILYHNYKEKLIPKIMTFEGLNFDLFFALTTLLIYYLLNKNIIHKKILLAWNIFGLIFVLNIVIIAVLSTPTPIQKFGFNQPNLMIFNFPYILLPSFIVPIVIYSHIISILKIKHKI